MLAGWKNTINLAVIKLTGKLAAGLLLAVCISFGIASVSPANALQSSHYQFQETSLGGLGSSGAQSGSYQVADSGGILGFGDSASAAFQIKTGNTTTNDPALGFGIVNPNASFGSFSPGVAAVATSSFQVLDYTSYGYVVQILGNPPNNGSHTIAAMSATGPSTVGTEQFGINLVANTAPFSLGANPNHGQFGVGSADPNYSTPNDYRYASGETIAAAPSSSGMTIYTISYVINVGTLTPGGQYTGGQTIVCTGTY